uniref:dihydropteroate synthase n=1 Tax=Nocardia brasiliensis TaxID=37326 RepID=UPI002456383B
MNFARDGRHCVVMGVVNVTSDSFSDGGRYLDPDVAIAHGVELYAAGAAKIVGGGGYNPPGGGGGGRGTPGGGGGGAPGGRGAPAAHDAFWSLLRAIVGLAADPDELYPPGTVDMVPGDWEAAAIAN